MRFSLVQAASLGASLSLVSSVSAQRSTEAEEAAITDPYQECTAYSLPAVAALQAAGAYPPIWEVANMSVATAADKALFTALEPSIPNIAPRGTPAGDFAGVTYDGTVDPDCWWTWKQCTKPKIAGLSDDITRIAEPNSWGLTYDDGPNCSHNAFYDYLESQNQKATLFYIGSNVLDWPLEAQRGLADGHELCAHTWSHRYMTSLTNEEVFAELFYSRKAIKDTTGVTVQCWRPPYGDVDDRVRYIAQALGLATVIWIDNTFDYLISTTNASYVEGNYNAIFAKQKAGKYNDAGTIVLSHELNNQTMQFAEQFLPIIKSTFKNVMPIAVANNNTQPYVETGYTYPNAAQWMSGTRTISLAAPTAVSTDASISYAIQTGNTNSVFHSLPYAEGNAVIGAATAAASTAGDVGAAQPASGLVMGSSTTGRTTSTSSGAKATATAKGAGARSAGNVGASVMALVGGFVLGAAML